MISIRKQLKPNTELKKLQWMMKATELAPQKNFKQTPLLPTKRAELYPIRQLHYPNGSLPQISSFGKKVMITFAFVVGKCSRMGRRYLCSKCSKSYHLKCLQALLVPERKLTVGQVNRMKG